MKDNTIIGPCPECGGSNVKANSYEGGRDCTGHTVKCKDCKNFLTKEQCFKEDKTSLLREDLEAKEQEFLLKVIEEWNEEKFDIHKTLANILERLDEFDVDAEDIDERVGTIEEKFNF